MYLLDTSALSELMRRRPHPGFLRRFQEQPPNALFTSAICVMELRYGASLRDDRDAFWRQVQDRILSLVHALEFGAQEALIAGELLASLRRSGRPLGLEDVLIGATARAHGYILVTHNVRPFERLPGLKVEDWLA